MSVSSAMYTGISGLQTNSEAMSVIGNNIANVNTVGFKEGRTLFSDLLSTNINRGQVGLGAQVQAVQNLFTQGSFETTGKATDLAIQGDDLFVLQDPATKQQYYTRAGAFDFDKSSVLTNASGYQVMGYGIDPTTGASNGKLGTVDLTGAASMAAKLTTTISVAANLDATQTPPPAWDTANPTSTSNFSTSTTVYDPQGNSHVLDVYFRKTAAGWDVYSYDTSAQAFSAASGAAGVPITFDANGNLDTVNGASTTQTVGGVVSPADPFPTLALSGYTVNLQGTTQYSLPSSVSALSQDGYGAGSLANVSVDEKGYVTGSYTNGQQRKIAQVALAKFAAPEGLDKQGDSLYTATTASGVALIDSSNSNSNKVLSNSLEQSNVDMATELVNLITTQRAYTANSKTITSSDQMMQDTLSLIR